jgi:hypothetical protein
VEFKTKDFSEFWLNNGGNDRQTPLPVELVSFIAKKKDNNDVIVEWKTAFEQNTSHFEIEVAKGNIDYQSGRFVKIGEIVSPGNSNSERTYSFADTEVGKTGVRYYRLKIVDRDNTFVYSPARPVVFNDDIQWQVYPNPSNGAYNFIYQLDQSQTVSIKIYDVNGKLVKQTSLIGNGFVQKTQIDLRSAKFAPGVYLLYAEAGEEQLSIKLIKQ